MAGTRVGEERSEETFTAAFVSSLSPVESRNCGDAAVITAGLVCALGARETWDAPECFSLLTVHPLPALPLIDPPRGRLRREAGYLLAACLRLPPDEKPVTMTTCRCIFMMFYRGGEARVRVGGTDRRDVLSFD